MKRSREQSSFGLFTSHTKSCNPDEALPREIHSTVISNWSSSTGFSLTPEQIDNSFTDFAIEKEVATLPTSVDKNDDFNEVIEFVDVNGKCKNDSPINLIAMSDLNTTTIGMNNDLSLNCDNRKCNPHFSHVTCSNICEQEPSSALFSSINRKVNIELRLALEGLHGIASVLNRLD